MRLVDFSLKYICGVDTSGLKKADLQKAKADCQSHLEKMIAEKLAGTTKEELSQKMKETFKSLKVTPNLNIGELVSKGEHKIVEVFMSDKLVTVTGHENSSMSGTLSADMWFAPLQKRFGLIDVSSDEGKQIIASKEDRWYRTIQLKLAPNASYFEPAFDIGDYQLGKLANVDLASNLFPDSTEVLASDLAVLGSEGTLNIGSDKKSYISSRVLAIRRQNGEVVPVLQILKGPKVGMHDVVDINKIEVTRQIIIPTTGEKFEVDLMQLPEVPKIDSISGIPYTSNKFSIHCTLHEPGTPIDESIDK